MKTELDLFVSAVKTAQSMLPLKSSLEVRKATLAAKDSEGIADEDFDLWSRHLDEVLGKARSLSMNPTPSAVIEKNKV